MATNVTERNKTLQEIIAWCDQLSMEIKCTEDASADLTYGKLRGLYLVYEHCQNMLGHSGSMPSEVPNPKRGREMNKRYKVCPLFWSDYGGERTLMNMGVFEELLNEGWNILRVDTMPPTELRNNAVTATNVYILEMEANDD